MTTHSVWMKVPATDGWSRVAGGISKEEAERVAELLLFEARAMPDTPDDYRYPVGKTA